MIQLPLFQPESQWTPPTELPDLSGAKEISLDTETNDPTLKTKGPGFLHNEGYIAGISLATDTGFCGYFPINHSEGNLDAEIVASWLQDVLKNPSPTKIFTNASYDLGWLSTINVDVAGTIVDVSIMEALLDEEHPDGYSLEAISRRHLGRSKDESLLRLAARDWGIDAKSEMWKLPSKFVGEYAEIDAQNPLEIWQKQKVLLAEQGLTELAALEQELTPILYRMMRQGIRVDTGYAEWLNEKWRKEEKEVRRSLGSLDIWSPPQVASYLKREGVTIPKTAKGNESVTGDFLNSISRSVPAARAIKTAREFNRVRETYLEQNLIQNVRSGRIHPQYVQMHTEDGGTRTGRLSCKNPNAQQFPKRSRLFDSKLLRRCLVPEEGHLWSKHDYWAQEPTLQCHYGLRLGLKGAQEVAEQFAAKIKLYTFIEEATGGLCNYDQSKEVVLGRSYGMGKAKMAARMSIDVDTCDSILTAFDDAVPFIGQLAQACSAKAQERGYVAGPLGRRRRFNLWEPVFRDRHHKADWERANGYVVPCALEEAKSRWEGHQLQRAFTYKAFNGLIQGAAATQTKLAIRDVARSGTLPQMTVHDEISASVRDENHSLEIDEIIRSGLQLLLPVQTDRDLGSSWC